MARARKKAPPFGATRITPEVILKEVEGAVACARRNALDAAHASTYTTGIYLLALPLLRASLGIDVIYSPRGAAALQRLKELCD